MPDDKSHATSAFLTNPNAWLAFLTVAGGLWLVSQKLTSHRPVISGGDSTVSIGDQKLTARLWEDPFAVARPGPRDEDIAADLALLGRQVTARESDSPVSASQKGVLVLPVMVTGGSYSEDRESRIRSRYAIVSALGRSGYVPEDAERIGVLRVPWPTQHELRRARRLDRENREALPRLWNDDGAQPHLLGEHPLSMEVRYEWYRRKVFSTADPSVERHSHVLVLWLDDTFFEHEPALRLALLLESFVFTPGSKEPAPHRAFALIGPRRSSTLRAMLPSWEQTDTAPPPNASSNLPALTRDVLEHVDLYCATPSAMDEVLVSTPIDPYRPPRSAVIERLKAHAGFRSVHNFSATDAQLAAELFAELELRGANIVEKSANHIVLISEWDSFYARMLSLTYGAELEIRQDALARGAHDPRPHLTRADYIARFNTRSTTPTPTPVPENFHSFVYLRGLDGQTVGTSSPGENASAGQNTSSRKTGQRPSDPREWEPDVNKAEGHAQFDYLGRIGDRLAALERSLQRERQARIAAIGIVGSDVYDTLLILQALRQRFPSALFFTTDLDVRFLSPSERDWARNLIVVSSYGLSLNPHLQGDVAPFRDSTQTAQFAAALAALGNRALQRIETIPPRRFEVGNHNVIDLSVAANPDIGFPQNDPQRGAFGLHPPTEVETHLARQDHRSTRLEGASWSAAVLLLIATLLWKPLRRVTWQLWSYPAETLRYTEEDVGGPDGAFALVRRLHRQARTDDRAKALSRVPAFTALQRAICPLNLKLARLKRELSREPPDSKRKESLITLERSLLWERDHRLTELQDELLHRLNCAISGASPFTAKPPRLSPWLATLPSPRHAMRKWSERRTLDEFLRTTQRLQTPSPHAHPAGAPALEAAAEARKASVHLFHLRMFRTVLWWFGFAGIFIAGFLLWRWIWKDTFELPEGEPFSLMNGISAWPATIVRAVVVALSALFLVEIVFQLGETFHALTRTFRLSRPDPFAAAPPTRIGAQQIWFEQTRPGYLALFPTGVIAATIGYRHFLGAIRDASGEPTLRPYRGTVIAEVDFDILMMSVFGFIAVAFATVATAWLCRRFIDRLSANTTFYPEATRAHFSRQMGRLEDEYLDEWIDLQLIAELTEKVGRLVYYPSILFLLMMLARNTWWDAWTWPVSLLVIFALNFSLALASVVILQRAAKAAKHRAEQSLAGKVRRLQAQVAPTSAQNNAARAEELLREIRQLDRGAFVPFWENPVVGALFLSSGGTTVIQGLVWFLGR